MTWPAWVTLAATVVNALAVVVLVFVTWAYAKAARHQAEAAKLQADAARLQANAAQAQAHAAAETLATLRQQVFSQESMAHMTVEGAIKSALANIENWQQQVKAGFALALQSKSLPMTVILTPSNSLEALESARRISQPLADNLQSAFDELNAAKQKIEAARSRDSKFDSYYDPAKQIAELESLLSHAKGILQRCQTDLYTIPKPKNSLV